MFVLMLSTCSRCQQQGAITVHTIVGAELTTMLPTRWRETAGGVVCDRCDHGDPARVLHFPTHLCTQRGSVPDRRAA